MAAAKRLSEVLKRHVAGGRLRAAFDQVNAMGDVRNYDRTALTRWLSGESTPSDKPFMAKLADILHDPEIVMALGEDVRTTDRELRDLITRFRSLTADRKRAVLPQLLAELFREDTAVRRSFTMRIELHADLTADCHRLDVVLAWIGHLPPNASVEVVTDEASLGLAYAKEGCIFRELVPVSVERFASAASALQVSRPVLRYKAVNTESFVEAQVRTQGTSVDGSYQFENEEIATAEIRLSVCLPYPAELPMYPVMLGSYAVSGRAEITMVTDARRCGRPHALRFLGHAAAWTHPGDFDRSELSVEIGDDQSLLEPNAGVIFFWLPVS